MTSTHTPQRHTRSHGTREVNSSRKKPSSSSSRPATHPRRPTSATAKARPSHKQSSNPSSALVGAFLTRAWEAIKQTCSGDVPVSLRGQRITSQQADHRVNIRLKWMLVALTVAFLGLGIRVVLLQTIQRSGYQEASIGQRTRVNILRAARGVVFDRNGNELALSVPSTTIFADPRLMSDVAGTSRAIAAALGYTPEQESGLTDKLSKPGAQFVYIAREMSKDQAKVLLGLGLVGISSYSEPSRQIEGGVAQAIIGSTDPDGRGISGLELQFDKVLNGRDGKAIREVDKDGRSIAGVTNTRNAPVPGDDIVLTVDKNIQFHMDQALLDRVGQLNAKGGTAIVMDSVTGDIYAMSNVRRDATGAAVLASGNFAAVEAYEPGSVAKVFSVSAALNEGAVTPESTFKVPGVMTVDKFLIRDAWSHGIIEMNVKAIVTESSNIGTVMTAQTISTDTLHNYLADFGFGRKTGLQYPGESRGILRDANKWRGTEKFTVAYGYGMAATPLQLVSAVNTVANKGTYVAPRLISATIDKSGKQIMADASPTRSVLKPETAATMIDILKNVVCVGTGRNAQVKGMEIAGKTGTGYKLQKNGTYVTDTGGRKYFASFVGFYPVSNPRITMLVSIDEPNANSRDRFGSTAAAPVFARMVPTIMHELGIEATGSGTGCKAGAKPLAP